MERQSKRVHVTVSTGMARLQFKNGHTIHSWSGYGDGHVPIANLLPEIKHSNSYTTTRNWIMNAEVLIIDELDYSVQRLLKKLNSYVDT